MGTSTYTDAQLWARARQMANIMAQHCDPATFQRLSSFDQTRLMRAVEQLHELQSHVYAGGSVPPTPSPWLEHHLSYYYGSRLQNLRDGIQAIVARAEGSGGAAVAGGAAAGGAAAGTAGETALPWGVRLSRFVGGVGRAIFSLEGALVIVVAAAAGSAAYVITTSLMGGTEEGPIVFIGPPPDSQCAIDVASEHGLTWSAQTGWDLTDRARPDPDATVFAGDPEAFKTAREEYVNRTGGAIYSAFQEADTRCAGAALVGVCGPVASSVNVWKPETGTAQPHVLLQPEGYLGDSIWRSERRGDDDLLVADLEGTPGKNVCISYSFVPLETVDRVLVSLGVDEETRHWVNTGCYWEIGIETGGEIKAFDADHANNVTAQIGDDGTLRAHFSEVACGIGLPAHSFLELQIGAEEGTLLRPR